MTNAVMGTTRSEAGKCTREALGCEQSSNRVAPSRRSTASTSRPMSDESCAKVACRGVGWLWRCPSKIDPLDQPKLTHPERWFPPALRAWTEREVAPGQVVGGSLLQGRQALPGPPMGGRAAVAV